MIAARRHAIPTALLLLAGTPARADVLPPPRPAPAAPAAPSPVLEKAQALKEAAGLLEKAEAARGRGNRSFAEQLFSSAELIVGVEAVADLAELFRKGAPPRVTTPLKTLPPGAPQPEVAGASDDDEPDDKPKKGTLAGTLAAEGGAADAFAVVTLEPADGKFRRRAPRQRVMEQRNRQFAPRVMIVPVGSTVTFPNFDPVYHNVFSTSEVKSFDLGLYRNGQSRDMTFEREGIISLGCNLHANMSAHIAVVSAPHYAVARDGKFNFKSLDPGKYRLRAWSERSVEPVVQEVVIKPDRNVVTVKLKVGAARGPMPDKFGVSRGSKP